jgi:hypothetical protein
MTGGSAFNHLTFSGAGTKTFSNNASTSDFTIDSSSGAVTAPTLLTIAGNYTNNGTFTANSGTIYATSSSAQTFAGTMIGGSAFNHLTFSGAGTKTFSANASTTNFTIDSSSGAVVAPTLLSIAGNYTNNQGTNGFTAGTGTTTFNGTVAQTISGNLIAASAFANIEFINTTATTTFMNSASTTNFYASTSNVHLEFAPGATTSVYGNFVVHGTPGNLVNLFSTTNGSQWYLYASSTTAVTYASVKDSNACARSIDASAGGTNTDGGGNNCWTFTNNPTLTTAANQIFTTGDASTPISEITVTDNTTPSITSANKLRIAISTSTTFMLWDTSKTTATFGGSAVGKVANPVSYEGSGSVLLIPVNTNFGAADTLTLSGLNFMSFATASAPLAGLVLWKDGITDQTADASNNKTITIKGLFTGAEHAGGQFSNAIDNSGVNQTSLLLYAFNLAPSGGENMSVTNLALSLSGIKGVAAGDITNAKLYIDYNANRAIDGGDTQVGGAGTVAMSGQTGAITFSSAFTATTSRNYLLTADVASVGFEDAFTVALTPANVTSSGLTSLLATTPASTVALSQAQHVKVPRGGGEVGSTAPTVSDVGGGAVSGGDEIGNDPDFFPPTSTGGTFNQWTTPSSGYASDNVYATAATSWFRQDYGGFGFNNVPSNATIDGIEVKLELSGTTAAGTISVALSWDGGTSTTTIKTSPTLTTADAVVTLGSPSDTWGRTWTPAQLADANFKVRLVAQPSGNTVQVDAMQVNAHYSLGGGGQGGGGMVSAPLPAYWKNLANVFRSQTSDVYDSGNSFLALILVKLHALSRFF